MTKDNFQLQIGNLTLAQAYFGQADYLEDFDDVPADGVLGLAYQHSSVDVNPIKPFIEQLVDSGTLNQPIFSIYLSNKINPEVRLLI